VIPLNGSRKETIAHDEHVYKERNLIERFFNKIKYFRRIATRYEKITLSFAAMLSLVGAMIWMR
jgi:transposase